jgi:hypothetical protein
MLIGALEVDPALHGPAGLSPARIRARLAGADEDPTPPAPRAIPPAGALREFLAAAEPGADSLALLALLFDRGAAEVVELFVRQKVTPEVVARARAGFADPG